jgi:hypothetical protein
MNSKLHTEKAVTEIEKEFGLVDNESEEREKQILQQFWNVPFWRWDLDEMTHYRLYKQRRCNCYNCIIQWPTKDNKIFPLFSYQKRYLDLLESARPRVACIKCRASGISEVTLRFLEWKALSSNSLKGSQVIIVSAPAEELSLSFMRRIREHLQPILGVFESRQKTLILNSVRFQTMPSHNLLQLRGISGVSALVAEESGFWHSSEEAELLPIILPLIQKNERIIMSLISTPSKIGSLMHKIHLARENEIPFKKVYIDYKEVLKAGFFSQAEIEHAKRTNPAFEREMNLAFGFGMSNLFGASDLQYAIELGKAYAQDKTVNPDLDKRPYPNTIYGEGVPVLACDPGAGDSRFAITGLQLWNSKAHIFYSKSFPRPMEDDMVQLLLRLWEGTNRRANIFVDFANVNFVRKLKASIAQIVGNDKEPVDITWHLDYIRENGWAGEKDSLIGQHMIVCPVAFNLHGADLLQKLATFVQRRWLIINPDHFPELIQEMQSVRTKDNVNTDWALDKSGSESFDLVDSLRLCMYNMKVTAPYLRARNV